MNKWMDASYAPYQRAQLLLNEMSNEEKLWQLSADMIYSVEEDYDQKREPRHGHYRNPGHFMHHTLEKPATPYEVTERINKDIEISIAKQPHGIPPIENGEALHGAQWGMATCFPQPIAMASSFDDALMADVADIIGKECAVVGVRQVFAPVINIVRDCRWGRTVETFGEDVLLSSNMGFEMCRGLEKNGVIATPKHFVDNYGEDVNAVCEEKSLNISFSLANTGCMDGAEVVQVYLSGKNCDVVMPLKELKAYKRVEVKKGCREQVSLILDQEAFSYYNQELTYGMHDGDYTVLIGSASDHITHSFEVKVRSGLIQRV